MRISPQQYFQEPENPPQYSQEYPSNYNLQPPTRKLQLEPTHVLCFVIIAIVAGVALGMAIAKNEKTIKVFGIWKDSAGKRT